MKLKLPLPYNPTNYVLAFAFLISTSFGFSQNNAADSLERVLIAHTERDSMRVELLIAFAWELMHNDISRAKSICKEAESIAKEADCKKCFGTVYYTQAWIESYNSSYDKAILLANKALKVYKEADNLMGESYCFNCLGVIYYNKGNLEQAEKYYLKSAEIDQKRNDLNGVSGSYLNIGNLYAEHGNYDQSKKYYLRALELKKKIKDDRGIANCLNNIGLDYYDMGNYSQSLSYYKRGMLVLRKIKDAEGEAYGHINIGSIYVIQEKYEDALKTFDKAIQLNKQIGNNQLEANINSNIGKLFLKKKEFDKALNYFKLAQTAFEINGDGLLIGTTLNDIAQIYLLQHKYDDAQNYFEKAKIINEKSDLKADMCISYIGLAKVQLEKNNLTAALKNGFIAEKIARNSSLLAELRDVSEVLARVFAKSGKYEEAYSYHTQFKKLSDSIFNKEEIEKIAQIEYEFMFQKEKDAFNVKEQKLTTIVEKTNEDLEKSQSRLLIGVILFLVVLLIASLVIFQLKFRNEKSRNENVLLEQKLLRSQMTPHFIFNSLAVLQGMILKKDDLKAIKYLSRFSLLLRGVLESSRGQTTTLSSELTSLDNYIALQNIENNQSLNYVVNINEGIDLDKINIPPMIIQPFIENAIEHAFTLDSVDKTIELSINLEEDKLICIIKDNGVGFLSNVGKHSTLKNSQATSITQERIKLLSKQFKTQGSIEIVDLKTLNEQGTVVTIIIPHSKS